MSNWIFPYLRLYKGRITLSLIFGMIGIGSGAMLLFLSGYLISKSSLRPENIMIVYVPIVAVRAFSIGRAVFLYLEKLVSHDLVLRMLEKMRTRLYKILEPQALFLRSHYQTGDLLGVLSDDIEHLQDLYIRTIFPSVLGIFVYSVIAIVFGFFDIFFALLVVFMIGLIVFLIPMISFYRMKKYHVKIKQERSSLYQSLTDAIFGLSDWQASGRINEFLTQYDHQDQSLLSTQRKIQKWHYVRDALTQLVIGIVIILTMIWAGETAQAGGISPTVIAAFTLMMFSITEAFIPVSEAVETLPTYSDSIDRIETIEKSSFSNTALAKDPLPKYNLAHLEIKDLSYQYPGDSEKVLKNIHLNLPAGKKVAILGRSGAGKSTLLKLMAGALQPTEGSITINGQKIDSDILSKLVSVFNQKPHLFATSIANNIRLGRPEASDEEIMEAVEMANLLPLISSLPEGIDTQMLEMGHRFSGGERQRIAFARVLLQQTPIMIVDEATIGLDPRNEAELLETMLTATKDKTVLWITHHLAGIEAMDEIIFLKDGKIFMQGSHEELMVKEEYYRKLYEMDQGM